MGCELHQDTTGIHFECYGDSSRVFDPYYLVDDLGTSTHYPHQNGNAAFQPLTNGNGDLVALASRAEAFAPLPRAAGGAALKLVEEEL